MIQPNPLHSLSKGSWFKLICGASYQHLTAVRSLAVAYSLAGADCIDVAADPGVIAAVRSGMAAAQKIANTKAETLVDHNLVSYNAQGAYSVTKSIGKRHSRSHSGDSPLLMVSINDAEDPHFRKAKFNSTNCPATCPQPCVQICPAEAINLKQGGVIDNLCYGCGRCIPICPLGLIEAQTYVSNVAGVVPWIDGGSVDALEIHTQVGHGNDFRRVWSDIAPVAHKLKLLAISCTDATDVIAYLRSLYEIITPLPCPLIWQTDGRSMSGDIGKGTTHMAITFAQKVLEAQLPGYVQLAGGTNSYTVDKLKQKQMLKANSNQASFAAGVAYGSYARTILAPILAELDQTELQIQTNLIKNRPMNQPNFKLEQNPKLLEQAVLQASQLVNQIKQAGSK